MNKLSFGFVQLDNQKLNTISGGVFHAYTARAVRRNYRSAVPTADAVVSLVRGFLH